MRIEVVADDEEDVLLFLYFRLTRGSLWIGAVFSRRGIIAFSFLPAKRLSIDYKVFAGVEISSRLSEGRGREFP